jgi:hypothetical protein
MFICMLAAVDVHRILHIDSLFTSAAIAAIGKSIPLLSQARIYHFGALALCRHTPSCLPPAHQMHFSITSRFSIPDDWPWMLRTSLGTASMQSRLTFQWDLWNGRPLLSLDAMSLATYRFLLAAIASLTSTSTYSLRQAEPFWLLMNIWLTLQHTMCVAG